MDHLVRPSNRIAIDAVPVFKASLDLYDGLGFENFPSRVEYTLQEPVARQARATFMQGWLYFGLLREILGDDLHVEDFVSLAPPDHQQYMPDQWYLTTVKLPIYLQNCSGFKARSVLGFYLPTKLPVRLQSGLLAFVIDECNRYEQLYGQSSETDQGALPLVLLSIRILIQTLDRFSDHYCLIPLKSHIPDPVYGESLLSIQPIQQHMLRQSSVWCPHQVQYLVKTFSYHTLVYLAELKRDVADWVDHSRCSKESRCVAYNIDDTTFEGRHVGKCSGCTRIDAPLEEMMSILEAGDIPLLACHHDGRDLQLSYIKLSSSTQYTAVSHLWSDGLGTPSTNSLPKCQLQRLVERVQVAESYGRKKSWFGKKGRYIKLATDPTLMWLDVYCVPASTASNDLARIKSLKAAAINRMVPTYALARQTLVLDYELQHYTPITTDAVQAAAEEEFLARMVISGWRSRCWTHQESQVSRRILIQCRGSTVAFDHSLYRPPRPQSRVGKELDITADEMLAWRGQDYSEAGWRALLYVNNPLVIPRLKYVWGSFHGKTTSQPRDALGIFANLMRLSAAQISAMPVEEQMRAILRAAINLEGKIPTGIFFSPSPRLPSSVRLYDFDRWIPRFPGEGGDLDYGAGSAKVTPTGFYLPIDRYYKRGKGCFAIKIPRPDLTTFHVAFESRVLEVSLCIHGQLPQLPEDVTHLFLVLAMPQSETAFEGVGACLIPLNNNPVCLVPIIGKRWFFDAVWYCSLRFRQEVKDMTASSEQQDPTSNETAMLKPEAESRDVVIRSSWYFWETPKSLLGRRSPSMTFWAWFSFWGLPAIVIGVAPLVTLYQDGGTTGIIFIAWFIFAASCFHRTAGLVERARWILVIQSYSPEFDHKEQWWKRLIRQLGKLPGQGRFDIFILMVYAYWPWLVIRPWEYAWEWIKRAFLVGREWMKGRRVGLK